MSTSSPRFRTALWVLGSLLFAVLALSGLKGYRDLRAARGREAQVEQEIDAAQKRVEALRAKVEEERSDPVTLEHMAREDLGLARPDDVVIVLPKGDGETGERGRQGRGTETPPVHPASSSQPPAAGSPAHP